MPTWSTAESAGWSKIGLSQAYNEAVRVTGPLAMELLQRVDALRSLNETDTHAFDNGCGTGVLTSLLQKKLPELSVTATDASDGMVEFFNTRMKSEGWKNVKVAVADSRDLAEIPDNEFSHTFSTFMICLAPEPDRIAKEMYRVTALGGVLGLGVWVDPWFGYFSDPWTKACKQLDPGYERPRVMDDDWTDAEQVKAGLQRVGFKVVELTTQRAVWEWDSYEKLEKYFFDGGNPGNDRMMENWKTLGRSIEEVRPVFRTVIEEEYGQPDGKLKGYVPAHLVTAKK